MPLVLSIWAYLLRPGIAETPPVLSVPCQRFETGEIIRYGVLAEVEIIETDGGAIDQAALLIYEFEVLETSRRNATIAWISSQAVVQPGVPMRAPAPSLPAIQMIVDRKDGVTGVRNLDELANSLATILPDLDEDGRAIATALTASGAILDMWTIWVQRAAPLFMGSCRSQTANVETVETRGVTTGFADLEQTSSLTLSPGQQRGDVHLDLHTTTRPAGTYEPTSVRTDHIESELDAATGRVRTARFTRVVRDEQRWKRDTSTYILLSPERTERIVPRWRPASAPITGGREVQIQPHELPALPVTTAVQAHCHILVELPARRVRPQHEPCAQVFEPLLMDMPGWSFDVAGASWEGTVPLLVEVRASPGGGVVWSVAGMTSFAGGIMGTYHRETEGSWWLPPTFEAVPLPTSETESRP